MSLVLVLIRWQGLIDKIDRALTFAIEVEHGLARSDIVNYDEIRSEIVQKLENVVWALAPCSSCIVHCGLL